MYTSLAIVSLDDYKRYNNNDLRKTAFFVKNASGNWNFRGTYTDNLNHFGGLAVDELYLIKTEYLARKGNTTAALQALNILLEKRWKKRTFQPFLTQTADEALTLILAERKKELLFRSTRSTDLRRLNLESRYAVTLSRTINNQQFTLPPNDAANELREGPQRLVCKTIGGDIARI